MPTRPSKFVHPEYMLRIQSHAFPWNPIAPKSTPHWEGFLKSLGIPKSSSTWGWHQHLITALPMRSKTPSFRLSVYHQAILQLQFHRAARGPGLQSLRPGVQQEPTGALGTREAFEERSMSHESWHSMELYQIYIYIYKNYTNIYIYIYVCIYIYI